MAAEARPVHPTGHVIPMAPSATSMPHQCPRLEDVRAETAAACTALEGQLEDARAEKAAVCSELDRVRSEY